MSMELLQPFSWLSHAAAWFVALAIILLLRHRRRVGSKPNLPPGPKPWPIIGNLNLLGPLPHRSLQALSQKHGPIMHLRLGSVPFVVCCSAEMAKAFLKTHDLNFATRGESAAGKYTAYDHTDLLLAPYGPYWRQARKICVMKLFTAKSMDLYEYIRKEERNALLKELFDSANTPITLRDYISTMNLNTISRMVMGKKYVENDENAVVTHREFNKMLKEYFVLNGFVNVGDLIPWIGFLDLQGLVKRMKAWAKKFDGFLEHVLEEHDERRKVKDYVANDMMDVLLEVAEDPTLEVKLKRDNVKALTQDLIIGGTETAQVTVEWAISELLKNPEAIKKASEELDKVIGRKRWVDEKDISDLPYIEAIVKEVMRLHPVVPILAPKEAREDCNVAGFHISKGTQLLVNVWSLGRDPSVWEFPNEFRPERFMVGKGKDIDVKGHDFGLLPFGAGRRMCPAYSLGLKIIQATVANLLHGFHWRLPGNMKVEDLNLEETYGLSTPIKQPLQIVVCPRLPLHLYSNLV